MENASAKMVDNYEQFLFDMWPFKNAPNMCWSCDFFLVQNIPDTLNVNLE